MSIFPKFFIIFAILAVSWASPLEQYVSDDSLTLILKSSHPFHHTGNSSENKETESRRVEVCSTEDCRDIAQMYAEAMDKNVDPCANFYQFTCGGWAARNKIPTDKEVSGDSEILGSGVENRLKGMLESAPKVTDILPIQQAKKSYQSCMATDAHTAMYRFKTIASILEGNGGWPMAMNIEDWKEDAHSWQETDEKFTSLTADYTFYNIRPWGSLSEDSEDNYILLNTPKVHEPYQLMLQPIVELFIHYNRANVSAEQLEKDIHDLNVFKEKMQEVRKPDDHGWLHVMKLETWSLDFDYKSQAESNPKTVVDWRKIIQRILDVEGIEINDHWHVKVLAPYYWSLIEIWNATDKRTIVNYIHWIFVNRAITYLHNEPSRPLPRWLRCLREMQMVHANAYWLVENYYGEDSREAARQILENLKEEFKYQMEHSNGINHRPQSAKRRKLDKIDIFLDFPEAYTNGTVIEYIYEGLTIGDDYAANIFSFRRYKKKCDVHTFVKGTIDAGWANSLLKLKTMDGPYVLNWNIDDIPAAYFRAPYFSSHIPDYVKYATVGSQIGHELGMATRANGRQKSLNILMLYNFFRNAHCIWEQSENYFSNETMAAQAWYEDIVDTIGMQAALRVYKLQRQYVEEQPNGEMKLPGFEKFTDKQMFFIIFGGGLCEHRAPEFLNYKANMNSPPEFRVNNGVYNTKEFVEAFNCPPRILIDSLDKCSVWTRLLLYKT